MKTLKIIFLVVALASNAVAQTTRAEMKLLQVSVTPNSGAYAVGQAVGNSAADARQVFTAAFCQGRSHGMIRAFWVTDSSNQTTVGYDFVPFTTTISASSTVTDHTTAVVVTADKAHMLPIIPTASTDSFDIGENALSSLLHPVYSNLKDTTSGLGNLPFFVRINTGTPTYGAAQTLTFNVLLVCD